LPDPVFFPADDQAVLYYNRAGVGADNSPNDPSYEGWRLHTWSNDACDAYADPDTEWANGRVHNGVDPNYGAYWILDLKPGYAGTPGSCHNFIIHIGTDDAGKEMGGADFAGALDQDDATFTRMNFTLSGAPTVFEFPLLSLGPQPVKIEGMSAHWLDANTLVSALDMNGIDSMKLHFSASADLEASLEEGLNGTALDLEAVTLTEEQAAIAPHLAGFPAFQGDWTAEDAKAVLKTQAVLAGYDAEGTLVAATGIQLANAIDQVYTTGEEDANEAALGAVYTDTGITAAVWAPTARNVRLMSYNDDKTLASATNMSENSASGVWTYAGDMSLDRTLYRYEVTVYHPITGNIEVLEVTDPYSVSLSTNGRFSRFVNLNDDDLKPDGWDTHEIPTLENPEDIVIYEGHIRDFSIRDESTSEANRGKYLAFTEDGSVPVEYLRNLREAGVNMFHMLPANDIATIEEDVSQTVDFNSTVAQLCVLNRNASVCDDADSSMTLGDLYASYDPVQEPTKAQALLEDMRGLDQFNWGYDPHHFNAPEGSYSSDPEGVARIIEMRAMNQALHGLGFRVALDVVYNHTNASGVFPKSVLDKVVPGYYHRYEVDSGAIVRETCCDDTEPRNVMMEKFMHDSLLLWTEQYKFDSFRFDIMSQASKDTMVRLRDAVQAIDPDNYFYGEGWTREDRGYEQANQLNMAGTEIGTFNDRIREAVRQGEIFMREDDGAALAAQDRVKSGMAGTLTDYILETSGGVATTTSSLGGYAQDPADIINYVSKHDNETLWDQFNYTLPADLTLEERVRAQNIGIGLPIMSQGIPFLQMGGDMLRSKSMDRNTFDAGDWFNYVDFTQNTNNWNVGLPLAQDNQGRWEEMASFVYSPERAASMTEIAFSSQVFKEFVRIRTGSPLFRLTSQQDIINRLGFHNIGSRQEQGLILMSLDDGVTPDSDIVLADIDSNYDAVVVAVNSGYEEKSITVNTATGFELHMIHAGSVDPVVRSASFAEGEDGNGTFTVPALTMAVFVKPQMGPQGFGLSAYATSGAPDVVPFGDTVVYLRGGMNGWGTDDPMAYKGDGIYSVAVNLNEGEEVQFKVASEDWSTVNLGAPDGEPNVVTEGEDFVIATSNNNLSFTADTSTSYLFSVDASDTGEILLNVSKEDPYFDNPVYLRGGMNGWGTDNPMAFKGDGLYTVAIDLDAATYDFKVATDDWATVNLGAVSADDADRRVELEQATPLAPSNDNLFIEIVDAESYVFAWDNSAPEDPLLRVFKAEFFGATPVYVRGGMNGWGTDDALVYQGDGVYSVDISLGGGAVEFKVASDDWATVNLGAPDGESNAVSIGVPYSMAPSNNNLLIDTETATFEFKVTGPERGQPQVTVSQK
jgi:pullulanase/glycogen debranching enzyme